MSTILTRLKKLIDLLSEINDPPAPPQGILKSLDRYAGALELAKEKVRHEDKWRNLMADLANSREETARKMIDQLSDADFKAFCQVNRIKPAKGRSAKTVKGKIIQKAVKAKKATGTRPAQPAVAARRSPDTIIPAVTSREATTELILNQANNLKSRATI